MGIIYLLAEIMHNTELINHFYTCFKKGDAEGMISCYDSAIVFTDPVFGELRGEDAKNMWRMLLSISKSQLKISFDQIEADNKSGYANWTADYIFTKTGRRVINKIAAHFEFQNGKIIRHTDQFNIWKWSQQTLGITGKLFGWTPFLKAGIRKMAKRQLEKYKRENVFKSV